MNMLSLDLLRKKIFFLHSIFVPVSCYNSNSYNFKIYKHISVPVCLAGNPFSITLPLFSQNILSFNYFFNIRSYLIFKTTLQYKSHKQLKFITRISYYKIVRFKFEINRRNFDLFNETTNICSYEK